MFADAVELLALMLAAAGAGLLVLVVRDRRRGRDVRVPLVLATGAAVALFGVQAFLADAIDDAGGGPTRLDAAAWAFAAGHRTPVLTALAEVLNVAGSLAGLTVVAAAAAVLLLRYRRRLEAAVVLTAPAAAGLLGNGSKLGYDRARPPVAGHLVLVTDSSLPSGHTIDATIVLGVLAVVAVSLARGRLARAAAPAVAGAGIAVAGAARVYLGVHWATDVVAGWLLGGAWVALSAAVLLMLVTPQGPRSAGSRPAPAPLGAGVARLPAPRPHADTPGRETAGRETAGDDRTGRLAS